MVLTVDAKGIDIPDYNIAEKRINSKVLQKIEDDLDLDEKVSILFLMVKDYTSAFDEVFGLYKKFQDNGAYIVAEFVDNHSENWKDALLEALCILQNRQVIRKLGICYSELEALYLPKNRLCSKNFNYCAKCLYMMCEGLSESQIKLLLRSVKSDLAEYETNLNDTDYLELHLLYWMKRKYISICNDGRVNLKNLLKHLKPFEDLELIHADLKKCEDRQNVLDTYNASTPNTQILQSFSTSEDSRTIINSKDQGVKRIKKGLCIIISQLLFSGQKTRFGTAADCIRLTETFKGFGFDVFISENLKKDELLNKLKNIPQEFGTSYDCLFVCILSHGCRGTIITSDEEEVSIEAIEQQICCFELKDVIKIVVVQACQGKMTGKMDTLETTDGPENVKKQTAESNASNIASYRNFCLFMSTIPGFVSVRHKVQGSWFIQELCNILQSEGSEITFYQVVSKVTQSVEKKRGRVDGIDAVAQLPELRSSRLLTDFVFPKYRAPS